MAVEHLGSRRFGIVATVAAIVVSPLLALSYFATSDGVDSMNEAILAGWIQPAREAAGPLLTFSSSVTVYAFYTVVLAILFPAVILGALATRSARPDGTANERWAWRTTLGGYTLFGVGLVLVGIALFAVGPTSGLTNGLFLTMMIPGLLLGLVGSTWLGIVLARARFRPKITPWILTLSLPLWFVGSAVFGHNSLGILPLFFAWSAAAASPEIRASESTGQTEQHHQ